MQKTFRYKRSIPVEYDLQGHIFFLSRRYRQMEKEEQKRLREICRKAAGAYSPAVLEYVTTDASAVTVCDKHNLSASTLERAVKRYYIAMADAV